MSGHSLRVILAAIIVTCLAHAQETDNQVAYIPCSQDLRNNPGETIYHFKVTTMDDRNISLSKYRGKYLLIVNVATYSSNTWQYLGLNALESMFEGFAILGFPSNQFRHAEPGETGAEILNGISHVRPGGGFRPNFSMFKKIDVNGENEHPLFTYLKESCEATRQDMPDPRDSPYLPYKVSDIRENFEKFLIDDKGFPYKRYDADTSPEYIGIELTTFSFFNN